MKFCYLDFFFRCNYISLLILLIVGVFFYVFINQSALQSISVKKLFRPEVNSVIESVEVPWVKIPPDKSVEFSLDLHKPLSVIHKRFLSFSIDASNIQYGLRNPSLRDLRLRRAVAHLNGGYLRVGGRAADMLIFSPAFRAWPERQLPLDGDQCSFEHFNCPYKPKIKKFSMSAADWNELNDFCDVTGLKLLFDINVLFRDYKNNWNSSNAELILDFSFAYQNKVDWQLGNEPNSFKHLFGVEVPPEKLAQDFSTFRNLLDRYSLYNESLLVGPDVTDPRHISVEETPEKYLLQFLSSEPKIDAITWHHYYTGSEATLDDFLAVSTYEQFIEACAVIKETIKKSKIPPKPIWIGETGSAYGGGAQNLSDRFVASLLWTDKLGAAARAGISLVVRQSLYRGRYALINQYSLIPNPDYWICVLFKHLVGETVLKMTAVSRDYDKTLRVYAHCSLDRDVVLFGVNIANITQGLSLSFNNTGLFYSLTAPHLYSSIVELNGYRLKLLYNYSLPPLRPVVVDLTAPVPIRRYSVFFLRITNLQHPACKIGNSK